MAEQKVRPIQEPTPQTASAHFESSENAHSGAQVYEKVPRDTQASRELAGRKPYIFNDPIIADGDTRELRPPGYDVYSLSEGERRHYGIPDHMMHCYVRNPEEWHDRGKEPSDRIYEAARQIPGLRPVLDKDNCLIKVGDLALCMKPRPDPVEEERASRRAIEKYIYDTEGDGDISDGEMTVERFRRDDLGGLAKRARRQHDENVESGMIGQTRWRDFDEAMRSEAGRAAIEVESERYRRAGRHDQPTEEQERRMAEARERIRAGEAAARGGFPHSTPKKIAVGVGATGIGKTTQQKLQDRGHR